MQIALDKLQFQIEHGLHQPQNTELLKNLQIRIKDRTMHSTSHASVDFHFSCSKLRDKKNYTYRYRTPLDF